MTYHKFARDSGAFCRTPSPRDDGYSYVPFPVTQTWLSRQVERDLRLVWPVTSMEGTGLRYPLEPIPDHPYYDFEMHLCQDYVYHLSELIDPFADPRCACGLLLEFNPAKQPDVFYSSRLWFHCPSCGKEFRPELFSARIRNGWTGAEIGLLRGGACYRFAVVIDCGKCLPDREHGNVQFHPELVTLCERELGSTFYQLNDLY